MKNETIFTLMWPVGATEQTEVKWSPRSGIISPAWLRADDDDSIVVADLCARGWARAQMAMAMEAAASAARTEWIKGAS
jgi:hypothetical protein